MEQLIQLHKCLLVIADEIKRICEKHNIPYYIIGGTLLGAVRHNGFIPWDDDFDIAMKREDYERFLEICKTELGDMFYLQNDCVEEKYCFAFSKVQLVGTEIIEDFSKNVNVRHGIFVDIFPLENIPNSKIIRKFFCLKNHFIKNLIWIKCGYGTKKNKEKISYKILYVLGKFCSLKKLKRKRTKLITKYRNIDCKDRFISDYPHCIFRNDYFKNTRFYEFNNKKYMGFEKYDDFLSGFYGDYMQLPPEEKRVAHTYSRIEFGKYSI